MSMRKLGLVSFGLAITAIAFFCANVHAGERHGLGRAATDGEIRAWDIDVRADGAGLPVGHGSVTEGGRIYSEKCAACHGDRGQGGPMDRLVGGGASLTTSGPVKTVGSFWPHASTLFDYVRRAMPFNAPQSLSSDETYSVVAYVLHLNGILPADASLDQSSVAEIRMPNRNGFVGDPARR
jgi:mono/diheme cytochrome c family protein